MSRTIFISHRHEDANLAAAIAKHLEHWRIPRSKIFMSSDARRSTKIGEPLMDDLRTALSETKLVILVYTSSSEDWSWCMYECGLATNPDTVDTRIIVFQFTSDKPKVFRDYVVVKVNEQGIRKFVEQFFKTPDFLPGEPPYQEEIAENVLDEMSKRFYEDLYEERPEIVQIVSRWDSVTLSLPSELVSEMKKTRESDQVDKLLERTLDECILAGSSGLGRRHFGFNDRRKGLSLRQIQDRWKEETGEENVDWICELNIEFWRSLRDARPQISWKPIKSAMDSDWLVLLVMNQFTIRKDGGVDFDIYTYRIGEE